MSTKNTPAPVDYTGAAEAQGNASQENLDRQTWANRPTVNTTFGQQTWNSTPTWDPVSGSYVNKWEQNINLAQPLEEAAQSQMNVQRDRSQMAEGLLGGAAEQVQQGVDWNALPERGQGLEGGQLQRQLDYSGAMQLGNPNDYRDRAEQALYSRQTARLDPAWEQRQDQQRTQLYNQGLREGDAAFDRQMQNFNQQRNDAYSSAMNDAITGGGAEAQRQFGMNLQGRQQGVNEANQQAAFYNQSGAQDLAQQQQVSAYQNQLRQQQLAEQQQRQGWNLNLVNSALSGQQVGLPQFPGFNTAGAAQAPQYLAAAQATGQQNMDQFNAQQMQQQAMMSGLGSLGSAFMPFGF